MIRVLLNRGRMTRADPAYPRRLSVPAVGVFENRKELGQSERDFV